MIICTQYYGYINLIYIYIYKYLCQYRNYKYIPIFEIRCTP